ncbi:MAG: Ig domain-containing protein [Comamonas sp.]
MVSSAVGQPATGISSSSGSAIVYSGVYGAMATPNVDGTPIAGSVSSGYSYQITATGGTTPYTFSAPDPSKLPPGLSLDANGLITGTPTAAGSYTFDVMVTDAAGLTDTASFTIVISVKPPVSTPTPTPVPASTPAGLVLLSTLLGLWAWRRRPR